MNDLTLASYIKTCCRRLNQQQTALINDFSLRTCGGLAVQPALGSMHIDVPGRGRAIATITPIARYCPNSQYWRWDWSTSESYQLHRHGAAALQSLAKTTGLDLFAVEQLKLPLEQTALLLAMACSRLKAAGYYCWRSGDEFVFLAINHMALATAPLEYSGDGDRLKLAQLDGSRKQSQAQVSQLLRPCSSLLGHCTPAPVWPRQRCVEGLFVHSFCQGSLLDLKLTLVGLKSLHRTGAC